jgi:hypothetical protein
MRDASHLRTICEVLREINDLHQGISRKDILTRKKLAVCQKMAKRMSLKLLEYNKEVFRDWWKNNKNYEKQLRKRLKTTYYAEEIDD